MKSEKNSNKIIRPIIIEVEVGIDLIFSLDIRLSIRFKVTLFPMILIIEKRSGPDNSPTIDILKVALNIQALNCFHYHNL